MASNPELDELLDGATMYLIAEQPVIICIFRCLHVTLAQVPWTIFRTSPCPALAQAAWQQNLQLQQMSELSVYCICENPVSLIDTPDRASCCR